jgi:hypothetical protein
MGIRKVSCHQPGHRVNPQVQRDPVTRKRRILASRAFNFGIILENFAISQKRAIDRAGIESIATTTVVKRSTNRKRNITKGFHLI